MNYWKQFAAMLGLELGQEFAITDDDGKRQCNNTYEITEDGISVKKPTNIGLCCRIPAIFTNVLDGNYKVVPMPWKPKKGEVYWYYSETLQHAFASEWIGSLCDLLYWKSGNFFKTKEEANKKGYVFWKELEKEYEKE